MQQSENTVQATVAFIATTSAAASADSSTLISALTSDINTYNAPVGVTVTASPISSGSSLALQVNVQFPPNNQASFLNSCSTASLLHKPEILNFRILWGKFSLVHKSSSVLTCSRLWTSCEDFVHSYKQ